MSNWSELSQDILLIVLEKLDNVCDYIRFCGVCSAWRSVGKTDSHRVRHQLPCLLFSSGRILPINQLPNQHPLKLPAVSLPQDSVCRGSYRGWLAILNRDMTMHLQNPISGQRFALPPLTTLLYHHRRHYHHDTVTWPVRKAILSSEPDSSSSCFVSVICCQGDLFYCKLGDSTWTHLTLPNFVEDGGFTDVIYHMGQLLALQSTGTIFTFDFTSSCTRLIELDRVGYSWNHSYMVHCGDELLIVCRCTTCYGTTEFEVHKQDYTTKQWRNVKDIGGYALFLGYNRSLAMLATGLKGLKPNHIYFSYKLEWQSQRSPSENDVGMYDLGQSKLKPLCLNGSTAEKTSIWWVPKLQWIC
ncbi:probable F-box protein At1g44080 [Pistacia vera]|uniref:probable F-box protein At1g44080 n=1 Tax=Pistacia vera TaxID=55513 RepID=UPI001262D328|nr:probable F-box protein At1g44080 [Pistacia vera]